MRGSTGLCDECHRGGSKVRDQNHVELCDACFRLTNELNNMAAENLRLNNELTRHQNVSCYLDGELRIQQMPAAERFMVPSWEVNWLLEELSKDQPDLVIFQRIRDRLALAEKQLQAHHDRKLQVLKLASDVREMAQKTSAIKFLLKRATYILDISDKVFCEVPACEPDDPSCSCRWFNQCGVIGVNLKDSEQQFTELWAGLDIVFKELHEFFAR